MALRSFLLLLLVQVTWSLPSVIVPGESSVCATSGALIDDWVEPTKKMVPIPIPDYVNTILNCYSNEYTNARNQGKGYTVSIDCNWDSDFVYVRGNRRLDGDGRVYMIEYTGTGGCIGVAYICVPRHGPVPSPSPTEYPADPVPAMPLCPTDYDDMTWTNVDNIVQPNGRVAESDVAVATTCEASTSWPWILSIVLSALTLCLVMVGLFAGWRLTRSMGNLFLVEDKLGFVSNDDVRIHGPTPTPAAFNP